MIYMYGNVKIQISSDIFIWFTKEYAIESLLPNIRGDLQGQILGHFF